MLDLLKIHSSKQAAGNIRMNESKFNYRQLSNDELQKIWEKHRKIIGKFLDGNKYDNENIIINENIILSIIIKVDQRKKYFEYFHKLKMSEFKEAALNAFWIVKLQPLSVCSQEYIKLQPAEYDSLNEKLALYYIIRTLRAALKEKNKSDEVLDSLSLKYINELIYTFTYRDVSKEAFIMLVETMAVFTGLDPYLIK